MDELIDIRSYPVSAVLDRLLADKSTGGNIIFATDTYSEMSDHSSYSDEITKDVLLGFDSIALQPRVLKAAGEQAQRTRKRAEVFTPTWIVKQMTDHAAQVLSKGVKWTTYVKRRIMEITCGEAPFLVNRYDTTTGELIPINERVGLLGRKLKVVRDNTDNEKDFVYWATKAYQYTYGYEFQGDSLLIARINMLLTFVDNYRVKSGTDPDGRTLSTIANIISWNIFQMDVLTDCVPVRTRSGVGEQLDLFGTADEHGSESVPAKIYDHNADKNKTKLFSSIKGGFATMKFDFVIGNPPYQEEVQKQGDRANPLYHFFMDAAYEISDKVEFITPARFLFNAGQTPKLWNKKMLEDKHFKILYYEPNSSKVFSNVDIKGGVAITYRDIEKDFGAIGTFTSFPELNDILKKVSNSNKFFDTFVSPQGLYRFEDNFFDLFPHLKTLTGSGRKIVSNNLEKMPDIFLQDKPDDTFIALYGRATGERVIKYIKKEYVQSNDYIDKYNVIIPKASGTGTFGETISTPFVCEPLVGTTDTFMSIGQFKYEYEANNCLKYIKTKFVRALLSVLKITQDITPDKWKYVPIQDFTPDSDIDWTKSVHEIDEQLYRKYGLSQEEIDFIESHVKEME